MKKIRIKMCGMTRAEDINCAARLGVDAIGLIFYSGSRRNVTFDQAKKLLAELPVFVDAVAVFVNPAVDEVKKIIENLPVSFLQFHGEETEEFCSQFNKPYIKALSVNNSSAIYQSARKYVKASAILLDTPSETLRGGTGQTFDWNKIPGDLAKPILLAGGLNSANVTKAVTISKPYGVDVCSGVEVSPGIKDKSKMSEFVYALWGQI